MKFLLRALCALLLSMSTALAAVDANTATVEQLQMITGVGPTIARRIVDERRHGAYRSLDDLQARVKGIGETSIRKMAAAGLTVGPGRSTPACCACTGRSARCCCCGRRCGRCGSPRAAHRPATSSSRSASARC
jgi:competence protein ComEA